jgi:hypothetical protein
MSAATTELTRDQILGWARDLYATSVDRKDAAGFAAAFTPEGTLTFGNSPTLVGRDAIREAIAHFFSAFVSLRHEARGAWLDGEVLTLEAIVTYTRHDGQQVAIPAVTIFHLAGGTEQGTPTADQCRIYVDLTPLFAAA